MRLCETGMANAETCPALKICEITILCKAQNMQYNILLRHRKCNILTLLYNLMYTCTWTHAEYTQFSVSKIIQGGVISLFATSVLLSLYSVLKEYCFASPAP